jgi:hypothetical protein
MTFVASAFSDDVFLIDCSMVMLQKNNHIGLRYDGVKSSGLIQLHFVLGVPIYGVTQEPILQSSTYGAVLTNGLSKRLQLYR